MSDKVREILKLFGKMNEIPRCSGDEAALAAWLCEWADTNGFTHRSDAAGNLIINVPASAGWERAPTVVFQAHMDMVCEKTPDSSHDFLKDPIRMLQEGDWLIGEDTSIGADNGAAIAVGMVFATDPAVARPPLELLFTVDEESGLKGARKIPADFIDGGILLNVDSEDEGVFTIGCAGGTDTRVARGFELDKVPVDHVVVEISAGGMRGGHSGIDIGKHRANANKILARLLSAAAKCGDLRLIVLEGGSKHNAIPREARAEVSMPGRLLEETEKHVRAVAEDIASEFQATEKDLSILFEKQATSGGIQALSPGDTQTVSDFLLIIPNGVIETVPGQSGRVETSCNMATLELKGDWFSMLVSQRSSVMSRLEAINRQVEAAAALAGATARTVNHYPAWPAKKNSPLLKRCRQVYKACFGSEPVVEIIHAGLECAVIGSKYPGMDMISFGPTMKNPHSPGEKLNIPSMEKLWEFLVALMKSFGPDAA